MKRKLLSLLALLMTAATGAWADDYTITLPSVSNGSVVAKVSDVSVTSAAAGATVTLEATPDAGYKLKSISGVYEAQATSSETINSVNKTTVTGTKFQCVGTQVNGYGWRVYNPGTANTLTVSSKDGATLITKIEFTSTWGNSRENNMLSVSKGTLSFDGSDPSTTVTINDINATSVTISGSGNNAAKTWCIASVKVYYEGTEEVELEISDTENANVKTFTMVDSEVTISAEFEAIPAAYDVTANLANGAYWATFYSNAGNYQAPEGTQVFTVHLEGTGITMNEVGDRIAKSGQGVVMKQATESSEPTTTITMTLTETVPAGDFSSNNLDGTMTQINTTGANDYYVLGGKNGAGFYKLSNTSGTIGANKAYLTYSGGGAAAARGFFLFDETTGIEIPTAESNDFDGTVYDLQGRRVQNPTKGLYIVNGKKVFINK